MIYCFNWFWLILSKLFHQIKWAEDYSVLWMNALNIVSTCFSYTDLMCERIEDKQEIFHVLIFMLGIKRFCRSLISSDFFFRCGKLKKKFSQKFIQEMKLIWQLKKKIMNIEGFPPFCKVFFTSFSPFINKAS